MAANAQPLRMWVAPGVGGYPNGAHVLAELSASKGHLNVGLLAIDSMHFFGESPSRSFKGVHVGATRVANGRHASLSLGIGRMSGSEFEKNVPDPNCYFLCSGTTEVDIGNHRSLLAKANYIQYRGVFGVGLMPYLIYGKSEFLGGVAVQMILGKLN